MRVDEAGVWIEYVMARTIPWQDIREIWFGMPYEGARAICFDLVDGPTLTEVASKRGPKKMGMANGGSCDFAFSLPPERDSEQTLNAVRAFWLTARFHERRAVSGNT